ncbi:MAG: zinc-binding alcohol dehydrogenase family protein [Cyclobacteriaceae bacterium]
MKYIVCEKPGQFELKEKPSPVRKEGEALLRVNKIGICGTDLHAYAGNQSFFTYPRVLGHELAAVVEEIEDNEQGIKIGEKVIVMPYLSCEKCVACRNAKTNCCTNIEVLGVHIDGGMQEKITVPSNILLPAQNLSENEMAIVEPLAIGAHAIRRAQLKPGDKVVVVGCGPIGIGIMKLAQIAEAKVFALDFNEKRLKYVKDNIGVDHTINTLEKPVEEIAKLTNGDMAAAVFDATGNRGALEFGPNYMSYGGKYILVGHTKEGLTFSHPELHAKETSLLCSRNATLEDFDLVIDVLKQGKFPINSYISHEVDFDEMIANFDSWLDPANGVIKAMVNF